MLTCGNIRDIYLTVPVRRVVPWFSGLLSAAALLGLAKCHFHPADQA
jgi:hypothetical protein